MLIFFLFTLLYFDVYYCSKRVYAVATEIIFAIWFFLLLPLAVTFFLRLPQVRGLLILLNSSALIKILVLKKT